MKKLTRLPILFLAVVGVLVTLGACNGGQEQSMDEQATAEAEYGTEEQAAAMEEESEAYGEEDDMEEAGDAEALVSEAAGVVTTMKNDEDLQQLLAEAKGLFIVPDYGKGAIGVGARGGEGLLVARENGEWSSPAFYDIGAVSLGAQIGGTAGEIALLLMTDDAVESFKSQNNFSLNADAGLTLIDYSARAQESLGKGEDVIFWSDTEGAFAGVSLSATDIRWDDEENQAFYGQQAQAEQILSGQVTSPKAQELQSQLPA